MNHGTTRSDQRRWRALVGTCLLRVGARLFATADAAARRNGWQITVRGGGLARSYRDPRFDQLRSREEHHPDGVDGRSRLAHPAEVETRRGAERTRHGPAARADLSRPPASRPAPSGPGGRRDLPATGTSRFGVGDR